MAKVSTGIGMKYARATGGNKGSLARSLKTPHEGSAGKHHWHGCARCDEIILCNCFAPDEDPLCSLCGHGRERPWDFSQWLPRDCCRKHSRVEALAACRERSLVGPPERRWWRCEVCFRPFPRDPATPDPPATAKEWVEHFGESLPIPAWPHERGH